VAHTARGGSGVAGLRAPGRISLVGGLSPLGREGIEVKIQARNGRRWQTIGDTKTTRGGRFHWSYRLSSSAGGRTYVFRARVASPIYPFATSNSRPILVRVTA
jgi:hypothetical protein